MFCERSSYRYLLTLFFLVIMAPFVSYANLQVYGRAPGAKTPQLLDAQEVLRLQTITHGKIPTWLALITELNTSSPKVHIIDTDYFKDFPSKYGIHQAYAQEMGLVSGPADFISKLKADGRVRSIMPFTFYVPHSPLSDDKGQAHWVLQNRRYIFKDSSSDFAKSLDASQKIFQEKMDELLIGRPFFITYAKSNSTRRPNTKTSEGRADIRALGRLGLQVIGETEMAKQVGDAPKALKVLNSIKDNQAFGYLKLVDSLEQIDELTPQHIAIFSELPDRVPPVASIVTLEQQTELSHINVLAMNRGTLNIAVNEDSQVLIANLKQSVAQYVDKPVRLKVLSDTIEVELATELQVSEFLAELKAKVGSVAIPEIVSDGNLGVRKAHVGDSPATIGAKAANYGRLERLLGTSIVKPGFAIGFDLYRNLITRGGGQSIESRLIFPLIDQLGQGQLSPTQVNLQLAAIRQAISKLSLPEEALDSLVDLANSNYGTLGDDEKIRFRSSTNCEDLPRFNGAGLYLSEGIKLKHLREALVSDKAKAKLRDDLFLVMGSLWLPRAFWEREYFSIDHRQAAMGIQINPSFTDEAANGVMVAYQKDGNTQFWINSQVGEAAVTNPLPGEVPESLKISIPVAVASDLKAYLKDGSLKLQSSSSLGSVFVDEKGVAPLNRLEPLSDLIKVTRRILDEFISDHDQFGIDIEFKLMTIDGVEKLFIKQARPLNRSHNSH